MVIIFSSSNIGKFSNAISPRSGVERIMFDQMNKTLPSKSLGHKNNFSQWKTTFAKATFWILYLW